MQRFGHAVRAPLLEGIAILIAEPGWFYEDKLAQEAKKHKHIERTGDRQNGKR